MTKFGHNSVKADNERLTFFTGLTSLAVFHWLLNIFKHNVDLVSQGVGYEEHLLVILM